MESLGVAREQGRPSLTVIREELNQDEAMHILIIIWDLGVNIFPVTLNAFSFNWIGRGSL